MGTRLLVYARRKDQVTLDQVEEALDRPSGRVVTTATTSACRGRAYG